MRLRQVEYTHEAGACRRRVIGRPDELDDLVDVEDGDDEPIDQVQTLLALGQSVGGASPDDADSEVDEDRQQLDEPERARLALDERNVVDPE